MPKREKPTTDPGLQKRIAELIAAKGGGHNEDLWPTSLKTP
jgi:hypothetical protein